MSTDSGLAVRGGWLASVSVRPRLKGGAPLVAGDMFR